jgi:SAM-dependent methyltransferase
VLSRLARYAPAAAVLDDAGSILDVGCGSEGLACLAPGVPFAGADISFAGEPALSLVPVLLAPGPLLPFSDAAFDTVLCLDVLEHVWAADRVAFLAELARVAARRIVLACPRDAAQPLDDLLRGRLDALPPDWLDEGDEPRAHAALDGLRAALGGFAATALRMPNGLLCSMIALAGRDPATAGLAADGLRRHRREWAALLRSATWGESLRAGWVLERATPRAALVPGGLDRAGLAGAVDGLADIAPAPAAPGFTTSPASSPHAGLAAAVAGLAASAPPRTDADLRLWLAPDWQRPETWLGALARYVAHAPARGSTCLCLDARGADLDLVAELVAIARETLVPRGDHAAVLVVDEPVDGAGTVPVASGADVLAALRVPPPAVPSDPAEIVARARRGKALADELRAVADHHAFALGGDPWLDPEPLVTIPISTWTDRELLVTRTIPSVLEGTYRRVEVLVCCDGPDPAARAAVERIGDGRVRFFEPARHPSHPSHPRSSRDASGLHAANHALDHALDHARGRFVAPLDGDDEFTATHVADLLACARQARADLVHAQALCEQRSGPPRLVGSRPLARGHVCRGVVLYCDRLADMRYDTACWLLEEPGDWNLWRRMAALGARTAFVDRVVLLRRAAGRTVAAGAARGAEDLAADVLGTDAAWYLDVEFAGAPAQWSS